MRRVVNARTQVPNRNRRSETTVAWPIATTSKILDLVGHVSDGTSLLEANRTAPERVIATQRLACRETQYAVDQEAVRATVNQRSSGSRLVLADGSEPRGSPR